MTEERAIQLRGFALVAKTVGMRNDEESTVMRGAEMFFERGWPSNHFTVGMAARAGTGLIPFTYEGHTSEFRYKEMMALDPTPNYYCGACGGRFFSSETNIESPCCKSSLWPIAYPHDPTPKLTNFS